MGYRIVNPIPRDIVPRMHELCTTLFPTRMLDDTAPKTVEQWIQAIPADPRHSYAVIHDSGEFLGAVWGDRLADDILLGHFVFLPRYITPQEKLAVTNYCLSSMYDSGIRKILWMIFADNAPFINFLTKRLLADVEGCLKEQERRNGALIDVVMLATFAEKMNVPGRSTPKSSGKSYEM